MKFHKTTPIKPFVGRQRELQRLKDICNRKEASVIVVHGRRRVGKTELIEYFFHNAPLLKFEGIQTLPQRSNYKAGLAKQIKACVKRLGYYTEQQELFEKINCSDWTSFFEILTPIVEKEEVILYFEEVQWLASYKDDFFAEMKPFWDDRWRHNKKLRLVFSGSSPSFIVGQFMSDKAFYNRKNEMFSLEPFTIEEISEYLGKIGAREKLLATLCVGGVPEYLHRIRSSSSILLGLAEQSFSKNGFFVEEYARIFVSSLSNNKYYKHIIKELAAKHFMTREELCSAVVGNINPGGSFTDILKDLESCGFIQKYSSIHLDSSDTKMVRYCIKDQYLNFFHRFIEPIKDKIDEGKYNESPLSGINRASFASAMGLVFEVWCRNHAHFFAKKLGFDKIDYDSGAFFNRRISEEKPGFQIDLIFIRKDSKIIIAEAKYYDDTVPKHIHSKVEEKKRLFLEHNPKYKNYTFETLLITTEGLAQKKEAQELFDHVITLQDIF